MKVLSADRGGGVRGLVAGWLTWVGDGDMVLGRRRKTIIVVADVDVDIMCSESADPDD